MLVCRGCGRAGEGGLGGLSVCERAGEGWGRGWGVMGEGVKNGT